MKKILGLMIVLACLFLFGCSKSVMTIEEITGVDFSNISYVKTGITGDKDYDIDLFVNYYKDLKYEKISGDYGNTAELYFICYNSFDEVLFTLVEIGNQDKVFIKKGSFDINGDSSYNLYRLVK